MGEKVIYEKHPVTAERKAELRQKGYKIIDAQFAPADYKHPEPIKAGKSGGGNKPKTEAEKQAAHAAEFEAVKSALTAKSIEFTAEATLDELKKLLDEAK